MPSVTFTIATSSTTMNWAAQVRGPGTFLGICSDITCSASPRFGITRSRLFLTSLFLASTRCVMQRSNGTLGP